MVISDISCMIDGFTIAFLTSEFGQVWARFNIGQCANYHTGLQNLIQLWVI